MSWWPEQKQARRNRWNLMWSGLCQTLGFVTRVAVYGSLLTVLVITMFVAWAAWPTTNIFETPVAALTLRQMGYAAGLVCTAMVAATVGAMLLALLFNPSDDPEVKKSWAGWGIVLIVLSIVVATAYFSRG
jgi:hypothetical protein